MKPVRVLDRTVRDAKKNPEVFFAEGGNLRLRAEDIQGLKARVAGTPRQRVRLCAHQTMDDPVHEMFIVMGRWTYVRPHKHRHKVESFHVVEGRAMALEFDDDGRIARTVPMGGYGSGRCFFYRSPAQAYHSWLILSKVFVLHEVTNGPFRRRNTLFAPWSPDDTDPQAIKRFLNHMTKLVGRGRRL